MKILVSLSMLPALALGCTVQPESVYDSFLNPPLAFRPFFRYWVPDATASPEVIAKDIALLKEVGAGGLEPIGFYNYGGTQSDPATSRADWSKFGWGTEAWINTTRTAFQAAKDHGLLMDFALGPNQGSGVPAEPETEGLQYDLVPFNVWIPLGGSFSGKLPGWGSGKLVAASTALVLEQQPVNISTNPDFLGTVYTNGTRHILETRSLKDVSDAVAQDGSLNIEFPHNETGIEHRLFAFYEKFSGYREQISPERIVQVPQTPVGSYIQNGSWVNDHFSVAGAQLLIDFWENTMLDDDLRQLLRDVGNLAWEDSMEFGAGVAVWWTPNMLQAFQSLIGYDFTKFLPLIFSHVSQDPGPLPSPDQFFTSDDDEGQHYLHDYWTTLTALNRVYLDTLSDWARNGLNCRYSAQVVYNLPMEMAANVPAVDVPESNLAGLNIVSNELGAEYAAAYTQTLPELISDVKRSIMGGANRMVYHGYPYSGNYPNTSWPGYTTFYYRFSSMHGPRQPAWEYYNDYMSWTSRMQPIAQSGVPKMDVAFWIHDLTTYITLPKYNVSEMDKIGFTYEYISPSNFDLSNAYVRHGVLAPDRQAFKALVIRRNDTMTLLGAQRVAEWALQGLKVVFVGGLPQQVSTHSEQKNRIEIASILQRMANLHNFFVVPENDLAESLRSVVGLTPKALVSTEGLWQTYWREDENERRITVILYNDAVGRPHGEGTSNGTVRFAVQGAPYLYDGWTGTSIAVRTCRVSDDGITIPLTIAGNQTLILAFHKDETPRCECFGLPPGVSLHDTTEGNVLRVQNRETARDLKLLDGRVIQLEAAPHALELENWTLIVESWLPPNASRTGSDDSYDSLKTNETFQITELKSWSTISNTLRNTSGRGFYTASFDWPLSGARSNGAEIDLGFILHTARVWINDNQLPPLDPTAPSCDISEYLRVGSNEVRVVVSTTLGGAVREHWTSIMVEGAPVTMTALPPDEQMQGLVAPVNIIPYSVTIVS
ncbi:hypothetical protein CB0940_09204 [Cercospora beticola]|uniref:Secreted protein n=1 Tax=Cercospora beticola TaxID=122368 RepID=A0A2G5HHS3_CERBT|nr:hypothetical protein CB0940_09204 [Cercospora beticola]PIA92107.1 hypothetical protein CB0940_09204 [Cercospora beticola]WPB06500.1 hypothetical protein RHO25_011157 [Cercospora beticola]